MHDSCLLASFLCTLGNFKTWVFLLFKLWLDYNIERPCESDEVLDPIPDNRETDHSGSNYEFGDWVTYWDEFYDRIYYYNSITHESTLDPPLGMEHLPSDYVANEAKEMVLTSSVIDDATFSDELSFDVNEHRVGFELAAECFDDVIIVSSVDVHLNETFGVHKSTKGSRPATTLSEDTCKELDAVPRKRKNKVKRSRAHRRSLVDNKELKSDVLASIGVKDTFYFLNTTTVLKWMKKVGFRPLLSVAKHHAFRCGSGVIVDCFTGVGGNAIRFAQKSTHVIAVDIDPKKIEYEQHNAAIYGVENLIEFITGNCFVLAQTLKADIVFLSPPWGGPEYAKARNFDINTMLKPRDGQFLYNVGYLLHNYKDVTFKMGLKEPSK